MTFENDIFISYAHIDDQPLVEGQKGWISNFHRALEIRLAQLMGRPPSLWRDPKRNPLGHGRDVKLAVTEYGLSWRTDRPRFLSDQVAGLWAAEAALRLAQQGVRAAHYFAYQGTGFHGLLDNAGVPRPTYYAFSMLSGLEGRFVKAGSSHPALCMTQFVPARNVGSSVIRAS